MKIKDLKLNSNNYITRLLYKPGWKVQFSDKVDYNMYEIIVSHENEPDASQFKAIDDYSNYDLLNKTDTIINRNSLSIDTFNKMKEIEFWDFVFYLIKTAEIHEITEWFKIDGKYLKNPHPGDFVKGIPASECFIDQ